ncbi:MAG: ribonuclease T2 [Rhodobacterales bacterium]
MRMFLTLLLLTSPAYAQSVRQSGFDYYVMSLSWTPTWCALKGDARQSPQCGAGRGFGFTLHGLWPQYSTGGYPQYCHTTERGPSRQITNRMADIMGTSGLAWYQWKKHGICSGLSVTDYYALARRAYKSVKRPTLFRKLKTDITLPASVVEAAFLEANPDIRQNQITITCKAHKIQEVRICLSKDLEYIKCGTDVVQDCTLRNAEMGKMR